jgi:beta-glucosidase
MYYPPFEAAISRKVGALVCSPNKINGIHACENNSTLNTHLKKIMAFTGYTIAAPGASHSVAFDKGLDQEQNPSSSVFTSENLSKVPRELLDGSIFRIFKMFYRYGVIQKKRTDSIEKNVTSQTTVNMATKLAIDSMILLKNDN